MQINFADALQETGFRSWVGDSADSAEWLVKKFGDVYLHETVISHIRRLLDGEFVHNKLHESPDHFMHRMQQVENHMNSPAFAACGGEGLMGLARGALKLGCGHLALKRSHIKTGARACGSDARAR